MLREEFIPWYLQLQQLTQAKRWRSLVVLVGDEHWATQHLDSSLAVYMSASKQNKPCPGLIYGDAVNMRDN